MLVLDQSNNYNFANMVVKVTDNTVQTTETATTPAEIPAFNMLIPTVQAVGSTNVLELYRPGETGLYTQAHGRPNALKYGFGPDFITGVLQNAGSGVGVYTVNLRGESATMANMICLLKYRVEADVPYTDADGNAYYLSTDHTDITTDPASGIAVVRDVLHVKFETVALEGCKKWTDLYKALENLFSTEANDEGYLTIPWFAVMYRGASEMGNTAYFNMTPKSAEYDGNMYYAITLFDGVNTTATDPVFSMDIMSGQKYGTSYYIENLFNAQFGNLRFMSTPRLDDIYGLFNKYLYTVEDFVNGSQDATTGKWVIGAPSKTFAEIDAFAVNEFGVVVDSDSINTLIPNAFALTQGSDGTESADELFEKFFKGEIIGDIASALSYRYQYIPDVGYNDETKKAIQALVKKRNRMTSATIMVGGTDSFPSALLDHQRNWYEGDPNIRQIAKVQSPMMYNEYTRRTMTYPASYFDTMALVAHFTKWGNPYQPFAGFDARWTGFIQDTMVFPTETAEFINSLNASRINVLMKDSEAGGYLSDQQMNTTLLSDQTEFNNAFLISDILLDMLQLVHKNHFKFNEAPQVQRFQMAVDECINSKYKAHSASVTAEVYRVGTIGRAKSANRIVITINMLDIHKFTDVELILTEED